MSRVNRIVAIVVIVSVFCSSSLDAACKIRELVPAASAQCPNYGETGDCGSGVSSYPQYYRCADAGTGESGRCECTAVPQQIATWYPCEEDTNWANFVMCVAALVGCGAACAACILEPTKISCVGCVACAGTAIPGCLIADYTSCTKGTSQATYRNVFQALSGGNCVG